MPEKNGYELRTELIHIAKDILCQRYGFAEHMAKTAADKVAAAEKYNFTTEDVIREAEKLYAFVKQK